MTLRQTVQSFASQKTGLLIAAVNTSDSASQSGTSWAGAGSSRGGLETYKKPDTVTTAMDGYCNPLWSSGQSSWLHNGDVS
jgi:hypothetical protein